MVTLGSHRSNIVSSFPLRWHVWEGYGKKPRGVITVNGERNAPLGFPEAFLDSHHHPSASAAATQSMHSQHLSTTAAAFWALAPCTSLNCNCSHVPDHLQASTNFLRSRTRWEQFAPCMFCMFVISNELMQNIPLRISFQEQQACPCVWAKGERNALLASAFSFSVSPSASRYKCYVRVKTDSPFILSLIFTVATKKKKRYFSTVNSYRCQFKSEGGRRTSRRRRRTGHMRALLMKLLMKAQPLSRITFLTAL